MVASGTPGNSLGGPNMILVQNSGDKQRYNEHGNTLR